MENLEKAGGKTALKAKTGFTGKGGKGRKIEGERMTETESSSRLTIQGAAGGEKGVPTVKDERASKSPPKGAKLHHVKKGGDIRIGNQTWLCWEKGRPGLREGIVGRMNSKTERNRSPKSSAAGKYHIRLGANAKKTCQLLVPGGGENGRIEGEQHKRNKLSQKNKTRD